MGRRERMLDRNVKLVPPPSAGEINISPALMGRTLVVERDDLKVVLINRPARFCRPAANDWITDFIKNTAHFTHPRNVLARACLEPADTDPSAGPPQAPVKLVRHRQMVLEPIKVFAQRPAIIDWLLAMPHQLIGQREWAVGCAITPPSPERDESKEGHRMPIHVCAYVMQEVATVQTATEGTDQHPNAGDRTSKLAQTSGYSFGVATSPTGGKTRPIHIMRTDPRVNRGPVTARQFEQRLSGLRVSLSVLSLADIQPSDAGCGG